MQETDSTGLGQFRGTTGSGVRRAPAGLFGRVAILWIAALALLALAGCASKATPTGLIYRVNPPGVSVQALRIPETGPAMLTLRLANFSTVSTTFAALDLELRLAGTTPIRIAAHPGLEIPALTSDVLDLPIELPEEAQPAIERAGSNGALPYAIAGRVTTASPDGRHRVEFESRLSPVPGRQGEFR